MCVVVVKGGGWGGQASRQGGGWAGGIREGVDASGGEPPPTLHSCLHARHSLAHANSSAATGQSNRTLQAGYECMHEAACPQPKHTPHLSQAPCKAAARPCSPTSPLVHVLPRVQKLARPRPPGSPPPAGWGQVVGRGGMGRGRCGRGYKDKCQARVCGPPWLPTTTGHAQPRTTACSQAPGSSAP